MKSKTPSEIKRIHEEKTDGLFFSSGAMAHMGDSMKSFGSRIVDGQQILYRKSRRDEWGNDIFACWIFDIETGRFTPADKELKKKVWDMV